jgi:hypothetical protein
LDQSVSGGEATSSLEQRRGIAITVAALGPVFVRRAGLLTVIAHIDSGTGLHHFKFTRSVADAPPLVIRGGSALAGISSGEGPFGGPYNIALEPSRPSSGAIMLQRRAAQRKR